METCCDRRPSAMTSRVSIRKEGTARTACLELRSDAGEARDGFEGIFDRVSLCEQCVP